ncbi:hypothetical protein NDU88_003590 [Pleurodeles waltl]|uniref:Uncharacterized protein n=1 Tax=Pleurodeles waltl TaxID=8319 RepID=A0AAV7MV13_PLEWA|nr:hypothetical protein NDU88_003590 [Pleurodeles waltl]
MADPKVLEAVALLRQAGRLDLLREGALEPGRPARRSSAGVAAAVTACSPPRLVEKVRGVGTGARARGGTKAGRVRAMRPAVRPAAAGDSSEAGPGWVQPGGSQARRCKAKPQEFRRPQGSRMGLTGALGKSAAGGRVWREREWDAQLFSDAAGSWGFGLYWEGRWCAEEWPSEWKHGGRSIAFLEFFPLIVAVYLWEGNLVIRGCVFG